MDSFEKRNLAVQILGAIIGLSGLIIVWYYYGWKLALGIFLMLLGANIETWQKIRAKLYVIFNTFDQTGRL